LIVGNVVVIVAAAALDLHVQALLEKEKQMILFLCNGHVQEDFLPRLFKLL
jgi:hypothetical protein